MTDRPHSSNHQLLEAAWKKYGRHLHDCQRYGVHQCTCGFVETCLAMAQAEVFAARQGETRDVAQCEPYLKALTRYIDGVYGMAMEHGVPAKDAAFHAKHMQDAVLGLRRILNLPAVSQLCSDGKHEWCMNRSAAESHCQCDCHGPAVKTGSAQDGPLTISRPAQ